MAKDSISTLTTSEILIEGPGNKGVNARLTFKNGKLVFENSKTGESLLDIDVFNGTTNINTDNLVVSGNAVGIGGGAGGVQPRVYYGIATHENISISTQNNNNVNNVSDGVIESIFIDPIDQKKIFPLEESRGKFQIFNYTEDFSSSDLKFYIGETGTGTRIEKNNLGFRIDQNTGRYFAYLLEDSTNPGNVASFEDPDGWDSNLELFVVRAVLEGVTIAVQFITIVRASLAAIEGESGPIIRLKILDQTSNTVERRFFDFDSSGNPANQNENLLLQIQTYNTQDLADPSVNIITDPEVSLTSLGQNLKTLPLSKFKAPDGTYLSSCLVRVQLLDGTTVVAEDYMTAYRLPLDLGAAKAVDLSANPLVFAFKDAAPGGVPEQKVTVTVQLTNISLDLAISDILIERADEVIIPAQNIKSNGNGSYSFDIYLNSQNGTSIGVTNAVTREQYFPLKITVLKEGVSDVLTIPRVVDGGGLSGLLTNESDDIPATEQGFTYNADYAALGGQFIVFKGINIVDPANIQFTVSNIDNSIIVNIDSDGFYSVTAGSIPDNVDIGRATLTATIINEPGSPSIEKTYTVPKTKQGVSNKQLILTADSEFFVKDKEGNPIIEQILLTVRKQNIDGDVTITTQYNSHIEEITPNEVYSLPYYWPITNGTDGFYPKTFEVVTASLTYSGSTYTDTYAINLSEWSTGTDAKVVKLTSDDYQIAYDQEGREPNPASIQLSTEVQGFFNPQYKWEINEGGGFNLISGLDWGSTSQYQYSLPDTRSVGFANPKSFKVSTREVGGTTADAIDIISIISTQDGEDSYQISVPNSTHAFQCLPDGTITDLSSGATTIEVYYGNNQLTIGTSGQFTYGVTRTNGAGITSDLTSSAGQTTSTLNITGMTADQDIITLTITARGPSGDIDQTFTRILTYSKAKKGRDNFTIEIGNDNHTFPATTDGSISSTDFAAAATTIKVKYGNTYLNTGTTGNSTFSVTKSDLNITTTLTADSANKEYDLTGHTNMTADQASVTLTITARGPAGDNTAQTFTRVLTYSRAIEGEDGNDDRIYNFSKTGVDAGGITRISGWRFGNDYLTYKGDNFGSLVGDTTSFDIRPQASIDSIDGGNYLRFTSKGAYFGYLYTDFIPVDTSIVYKFESRMRQGTFNGALIVACYFFDKDKILLDNFEITYPTSTAWLSSSVTITGTPLYTNGVTAGNNFQNAKFATNTKYVRLVITVDNTTSGITSDIDYVWFYENKANLGPNDTLPVNELTEDEDTFFFNNDGTLSMGRGRSNPFIDGLPTNQNYFDSRIDIDIITGSSGRSWALPDSPNETSLGLTNSGPGDFTLGSIQFRGWDGRIHYTRTPPAYDMQNLENMYNPALGDRPYISPRAMMRSAQRYSSGTISLWSTAFPSSATGYQTTGDPPPLSTTPQLPKPGLVVDNFYDQFTVSIGDFSYGNPLVTNPLAWTIPGAIQDFLLNRDLPLPALWVTGSTVLEGSTTILGNLTMMGGTVNGNITGTATKLAWPGNVAQVGANPAGGLYVEGVYNNGYPTTYGNVVTVGGGGFGQLLIGWSGASGAHANNYIRSLRDTVVSTGDWSPWALILTDQNGVTLGSNQSISGIKTFTNTQYFGGAANLNTDNIVIGKMGVVSAGNIPFTFSHRSNNTELLLYGYNGTTYKNLMTWDYSNGQNGSVVVSTGGSVSNWTDFTVKESISGSTSNGGISIERKDNDHRWKIGHGGGNNNLYFSNGTSSISARGYIDAAATNHALFTGQHRNITENKDLHNYSSIGLIVVSKGTYVNIDGYNNPTINESLPVVDLTTQRNDKKCFGVISGKEDGEERNSGQSAFKTVSAISEGDHRLIVNSLGEGAIWVCNINGNLENGDYITTCEVPGYGMKQDDDLLHNYTVAKITCDCDFDLQSPIYICEEFEWEGQTYRRAFVGCTYHCG